MGCATGLALGLRWIAGNGDAQLNVVLLNLSKK